MTETAARMVYGLYIAAAAGAAALYLMMPRTGVSTVRLGAILGAATLAGAGLYAARFLPEVLGISDAAMLYFYIFSAIAIGAASRVITHTRPVYSALWFIMVMLATAGLFLVLDAEFMAFAMVIVYGGAILVTYVFVIMLASASGGAENCEDGPGYDRVAREPASAVLTGFLLLATLTSVLAQPVPHNPATEGPSGAYLAKQVLPERPAARLAARLGPRQAGETDEQVLARIPGADSVDNTERVGLDLFQSHPLGLELAGVILLVAVVGAVVIARRRGELPEPGAEAESRQW